jgi:hypothetical protein
MDKSPLNSLSSIFDRRDSHRRLDVKVELSNAYNEMVILGIVGFPVVRE